MEIKEELNQCYVICDEIEKSGIVKDNLTTPLKEALRMDFLKFLAFLSSASIVINHKEQKFIKENLPLIDSSCVF